MPGSPQNPSLSLSFKKSQEGRARVGNNPTQSSESLGNHIDRVGNNPTQEGRDEGRGYVRRPGKARGNFGSNPKLVLNHQRQA